MNTKTKLIALTTATLIAVAPTTASAMSFSDNVFSWPTDYKTEKTSTATSTFDGNAKKLDVKQPSKNKTQAQKRK